MEVIDWVARIKGFINAIKVLITTSFDFLPTEIKTIFLAVVVIVIGLYLYRFVRW